MNFRTFREALDHYIGRRQGTSYRNARTNPVHRRTEGFSIEYLTLPEREVSILQEWDPESDDFGLPHFMMDYDPIA